MRARHGNPKRFLTDELVDFDLECAFPAAFAPPAEEDKCSDQEYAEEDHTRRDSIDDHGGMSTRHSLRLHLGRVLSEVRKDSKSWSKAKRITGSMRGGG